MIKTRFAPSPTGYLHVGGLRTALYNYLFARQNKGVFLLRIEDTDQSRKVDKADINLVEILQKMGLIWDEGPSLDKDRQIIENGQNKPYFQSKRLEIYQKAIKELILAKKAYYCFCSSERLDELRKEQMANKLPPKYDQHCRHLNEQEVRARLEAGESRVIRLAVPENREVIINDLIRGEVKIQSSEIDDQVLMKSDGFPTYHLAVVVDDHAMQITHVIRGDEWLPSTPKHILLYEAFGWPAPQFAHLPLLLNKDKSKLSKRQGDVAVEDFLAKGYLVEALINYIALLGWHPADDREIFSLEELINEFSLERVQKAGAVFDLEKLNWLNGYYLRLKSVDELFKLARPFYPDTDEVLLKKILKLQQERMTTLAELQPESHFLTSLPDYQPVNLIYKKSDKQKTIQALQAVEIKLKNLSESNFVSDKLQTLLSEVVTELQTGNGDVFWPVRVAVSGQEKSPPPNEIMEALGKDESLTRIKLALKKLSFL